MPQGQQILQDNDNNEPLKTPWLHKVLATIVLVLLSYFLWQFTKSLPTFLMVLGFIILGFYLPKKIGQQARKNKAAQAKKAETSKWGFCGRDKDGPWVNAINYPVVRQTSIANDRHFYSEWLVIENGNIIVNPGRSSVQQENNTISSVTYQLDQANTYAWDGCTPKRWFYWIVLVGSPDWWFVDHKIKTIDKQKQLIDKTVWWQLSMHATLFHDALYQYLEFIPISRADVDQLFYDMLIESGTPTFIATGHYYSVRLLGKKNRRLNNTNVCKDIVCESFVGLFSNKYF